MKRKALSSCFPLVTLIFLFSGCKKSGYDNDLAGSNLTAEIISTKDIYENERKHVAFTDLTSVNGKYYLIFREGDSHYGLGDFGKIVLMESDNFSNWSLLGKYEQDSVDIRDPKFLKDNDRLLVSAVGVNGGVGSNLDFDNLLIDVDVNDEFELFKEYSRIRSTSWIWSYNYDSFSDHWFSSSYDRFSRVGINLHTRDLMAVERKYSISDITHSPNEGRILFSAKSMHILLRRNDGTTLLGEAPRDSIENISWLELPIERLGGPNMVRYKDHLIISGRDYVEGGTRTSIFDYDLNERKLYRLITLPSWGDTGYAGMILNRNDLYVSYYSMSRESTVIRTAYLRLK